MMLFNLSFKNIKKSFKDYVIYFVTLILGITIFYIFNSLQSQTVMLEISDLARDIIKMMNDILSGVSVFVSFVLGFLIVYANRFLMKRRKREFGIYMILGMSKQQISKILIVETLIIGLISLVVGLVLGIVLSQVMSIIVANMFEADMNRFTFVLSGSALLKTICYFGIMYLLVIVFNTVQVNRQQLINLMTAHQQNELITNKNPIVCLFVFICAVLLLSYAYYNVTSNVENLTTFFSIILQMIYGALATYLIYWSLSGLLLKLVLKIKSVYFKNLNSFTVSQVVSKINTTILSTTVICLLLFLTICIFSSAVALNDSANSEIDELVPVDLQMITNVKDSQMTVKEYLNSNNINLNDEINLQEELNFETYYSDELTYGDTYGNMYSDVSEEFLNEHERIIEVSAYNQVAKLYNLPTYQLENEYVVMGNYNNVCNIRNMVLKNKPDIELNGKVYHSKFASCQYGFLTIQSSPADMGFYIVPDEAVKNLNVDESFLIGNYSSSKAKRDEINEKLLGYRSDDLIVTTKLEIATNNIGTGAMVIFIGLYIGLVFLISCAAILALKELSQCIDNKEKYQILRKIGVDEKMINKSLFIQIAIYFAFPLILALIHSIFGIQVCKLMLESSGQLNVFGAIKITILFLIIIYGGYFYITYLSAKNIIKER